MRNSDSSGFLLTRLSPPSSLLPHQGKLVCGSCPAWLQVSPSLPHVETEGRSGRTHRTCGNCENTKAQDMQSSRMGRAPETLGTQDWEGTSFSRPLNYGSNIVNYGSNIHCCRPLVCTAQEKIHLLEHPSLLLLLSHPWHCIL